MNKQSLQSFKRTLRERFSSLFIWTKHYHKFHHIAEMTFIITTEHKDQGEKNCESKIYFSQKHLKADVWYKIQNVELNNILQVIFS